MRMYDLIERKKHGGKLSRLEIHEMVQGFVQGEIPDYQMAAMLMAVYFKGMDQEETLGLTLEMASSGDMVDLSGIEGIKVDKHSTGGVGDKTTLVIGPLAASLGVKVAKMSGRGLGHTGGTIDKLESIPGLTTAVSQERFFGIVNETGIAVIGQSGNMVPADKKLYALRDVTATVDNMSLIASSIMSKKLAAGADAIVLDVKTGSGAFMKKEADARALAEEMVKLGKNAGRKTAAVISDMDEPLGYAVGNALEVKEAIDTLRGEGPEDFVKLCLTLGSRMVVAGGMAESAAEAEEKLRQVIADKSALHKLAEFVEAQGGDREAVYHTELLPQAAYREEIPSPQAGYVERIVCDEIGVCSLMLGGGRETKESPIDLSVGLLLRKKVGDYVAKGEALAVIHGNDREKMKAAAKRFTDSYAFSPEPVAKRPLIKAVIE